VVPSTTYAVTSLTTQHNITQLRTPLWQVTQAVLHGFDCVYAPLISGYGSVCASLDVSPGTAVSTFVTHLSPRQLSVMHATEGGYHYLRLTGLQLREGCSLEDVRCGWTGRG